MNIEPGFEIDLNMLLTAQTGVSGNSRTWLHCVIRHNICHIEDYVLCHVGYVLSGTYQLRCFIDRLKGRRQMKKLLAKSSLNWMLRRCRNIFTLMIRLLISLQNLSTFWKVRKNPQGSVSHKIRIKKWQKVLCN